MTFASLASLSFFVIIGLNGSILAQKNEIDSLSTEYSNASNDSIRFEIALIISDKFRSVDSDSSFAYALKALKIAREISQDYYLAKAHHRIGNVEIKKGNSNNALFNLDSALSHSQKMKDQTLTAKIYLLIGNVHFVSNQFPEAILKYKSCIDIVKNNENSELIIESLINIGAVYFTLEDYKRAIEYFDEAKQIVEEIDDQLRLPLIYYTMARVEMKNKNYDLVKGYVEKIIAMKDSNERVVYHLFSCYELLGKIAFEHSNFNEALDQFKLSLQYALDPRILRLGTNSNQIGLAQLHIGESHHKLDSIPQAINALTIALEMANSGGYRDIIRDASLVLSGIYEQRGNNQLALKYYKDFAIATDSILNESSLKKITRIQMEHEFADRLKEQALLKVKEDQVEARRENILFVILTASILAFVITVLLFLLQKNKTKRLKLNGDNLQLNLDFKNQELTSNVLHMLQKNELLMNISDKLKKIIYKSKASPKEAIEEIIKEIEFNSKEVGWAEFELRFKEVHVEFYNKLNAKFPDLSPNEQRLCAFLRLNMSTKDISAITFQTIHTINQARSRMKKKMGIEDNERLLGFLNQI